MYTIYKHTSPSGKVYIGQTVKKNLNQRWLKGVGYKDTPLFWKVIQKYGWDNILHEVIQTTDTKEKADILEKMWISFYRKHTGVYNLTNGGEGTFGWKHSIETRKRFSQFWYQYWSTHPHRIGKDHPCYGKPRSEETKKRISEAKKGKKRGYSNTAIEVIDTETGMRFKSLKDASIYLNKPKDYASRCFRRGERFIKVDKN